MPNLDSIEVQGYKSINHAEITFNQFVKYHFQETGKSAPLNNLSHIEKDHYFLYENGENIGALLYKISMAGRIFF